MESINKFYDVEKIVNKKNIGRKIYYLIKWLNYPIEDCTWEPLTNLENVKHMVERFNAEYPESVDERMFKKYEKKITSIKKETKITKKFLNKKLQKENCDFTLDKNEEDSLDLLKSHLYIGKIPENLEKNKNRDFLKSSFSKEMSETLSTTKEEIQQESELANGEEDDIFSNYFKYENNLVKPSLFIKK